MENLFDEHGQLLPEEGHGAGCPDNPLKVVRDKKLAGNAAFGSKNWVGAAKLYAEAIRTLQEMGYPCESKCELSLSCGQRVSISNGESNKEGIIAYDNSDGTYDIMYDDGGEGDAIRSSLLTPILDDAHKDLKQAVVMQPNNAEYRLIYEECKQRIKTRNEENRKTAAMMLSYMRSEGVTGS